MFRACDHSLQSRRWKTPLYGTHNPSRACHPPRLPVCTAVFLVGWPCFFHLHDSPLHVEILARSKPCVIGLHCGEIAIFERSSGRTVVLGRLPPYRHSPNKSDIPAGYTNFITLVGVYTVCVKSVRIWFTIGPPLEHDGNHFPS